MKTFRDFVQKINENNSLEEWNGNIHDTPIYHKFGADAAKERKSPYPYDPNSPMDSEAAKHMHQWLTKEHKAGRIYNPANKDHAHALATQARKGWAKGVDKLDDAGKNKEKVFSNGYKLKRKDNAAIAHKNPDPNILKKHLIGKGVPEKEAHEYCLPYDTQFGVSAATVFNRNRKI